MMAFHFPLRLALIVGICLLFSNSCQSPRVGKLLSEGGDYYSRTIQPIFDANCISCHSGSNAPEGVRLVSYGSVMQGTENGEAIVIPFNSDSSLIIRRLRGLDLPQMPFGKTPLSSAEIDTIAAWIDRGAFEE